MMSSTISKGNSLQDKLRRTFTALFLSILAGTVHAQQSSSPEDSGESSVVAADLEMIYEKTDSATSIQDYSEIIDFCRKVAGESARPQEDRKYAKNLMSWALNRRGEARSDQAGTLVRSQKLDEASKLDALAKKDFETAIQMDPTRWRAHHNLGVTQAVQGQNSEAVASFTQVIRLNADYPNAYFNRGEIFFRTNKLESALGDYNRVIQLSSEDSSAFSARAHTLFAMGNTKEALADYEKAMSLAPQSVDAATEYADTCQALGMWKEAASAYQRAMQLDNANAKTLQNAAWMMATCPDDFYRNADAALKTAKRAVQVASGTNPQVLDVLAAAQAAAGDFDAAQKTIATALRTTTDQSLRSELQMRGKLYQRKTAYVQPRQ